MQMHSTVYHQHADPIHGVCRDEWIAAYPHNSQCHLGHPKPPLNIPGLSNTPDNRRCPPLASHAGLDVQQLGQECECAPEPPPCCWGRAQRARHYQWHIPPAVDSQNHGDARMHGRRSSGLAGSIALAAGGVGRGWGWDWRGNGGRGSHVSGEGWRGSRGRFRASDVQDRFGRRPDVKREGQRRGITVRRSQSSCTAQVAVAQAL
jgi:hypothetical protein